MHVLVDALSVNNLSGLHVLSGHVNELARALPGRLRFTLLTSQAGSGARERMPALEDHVIAPVGPGWLARNTWMLRHARRVCRDRHVDVAFSPAGLLSIGCDVPQVVLAQNPWPLVPGVATGVGWFKAQLQRGAFGRAQRSAAVMVFNSHYMRELYDAAFGRRTGPTQVAYQGISEDLFTAGRAASPVSERAPMVLSISAMARHKAVEVLVAAFAIVAQRMPDAELVLAGGWPDASYRTQIEGLVSRLGLQGRVRILGHIDHATLLRLQAQARVFSLLSRCESFGIPAVEAQAFGTPTVVASGTAAPEVAGPGGIVVRRDDPAAAADALLRLLQDDEAARDCSRKAVANAARFHWPQCSAPLVDCFRTLERAND